MNKPILEEDYKGYHVAIYQDLNAEGPTLSANEDICGWSRHFTVENKHINKNVFGALMKMDGYEQYAEEAKDVEKHFHVFPIDAYVHSGIVLSLHGEGMRDQWDTSYFVGCVIIAKAEEKERSRADKIARTTLQEWNDYLNGQVYGYIISEPKTCQHCHHTGYEEVESLWGIYGEANEAQKWAREAVDTIQKP